jgi:ankyrin repeat protein
MDHGADVHARSKNGRTPLIFAKNADIAQVLLSAGADINAQDKRGNTALKLAKKDKLRQFLIEHGAK